MEYSNLGPWGITLNKQLNTNASTNTAFSQLAWESAKQDGCLAPPDQLPLPQWPPKINTGFVYPVQDKGINHVIGKLCDGHNEQSFKPPYKNKQKVKQAFDNYPINEYAEVDEYFNVTKKLDPQVIAPCIKNTLNGIAYDLKNWNKIDNKHNKLVYIFCRDDRWLYLLILLIGAFAILQLFNFISLK